VASVCYPALPKLCIPISTGKKSIPPFAPLNQEKVIAFYAFCSVEKGGEIEESVRIPLWITVEIRISTGVVEVLIHHAESTAYQPLRLYAESVENSSRCVTAGYIRQA
jgi:hypothetical protein